MITFEIYLILYSIAILTILLLSWLVRRMGHEKLGKGLRKYLLIILGMLILAYHIYDYRSRHHYYQFDLSDRYAVELELIEYDSFLDYPVDLEFEIEDKDTHDTFYFEISSGEGPFFQILTSKTHPNLFLIKGYDTNEDMSYRVDLVEKTVKQNHASTKDTSAFKVVAELTYGLKLVKR